MSFLRDFGKDFVKGFFGYDFVKDYKHASKVFVSDNHALAPRNKFLFHVFFEINTSASIALTEAYGASDSAVISVLVKTFQLPSYEVETEILNQYNRKRVVQKKINYSPVEIALHDDGSDYSRKLWHHYYAYHYGDSYASPDDVRDIYESQFKHVAWGLQGEPMQGNAGLNEGQKLPFFKRITVFGFNRKRWVAYEIINPLIKSWSHDTYDYSQGGGVMENRMTVDYEYVKYYEGEGFDQVLGFGNPENYDKTASPLGGSGATDSILGQGGVLDSAGNIFKDISNGNILGAIRNIGSTGSQVRRITKEGVFEEAVQVIRQTTTTATREQFARDVGHIPDKPNPGITIPMRGKIK